MREGAIRQKFIIDSGLPIRAVNLLRVLFYIHQYRAALLSRPVLLVLVTGAQG